MILLRKQHSLAPEVPVRAWLYGVMRKLASRYHRGRTRRSRLRDAIHDEGGHSPESSAPRRSANPERVYDHLEAADLLDRFLDGLTTGQREVFVLAELEQLSGKEIAAALEVNQNTVWSRLRSARQAFDRSFAAVRAEHRRLSHRDPTAPVGRSVLSLSRRAHHPTEADRQRVGALLGLPLLGPGAGGLEALGQPSPSAALPGARGLASLVATSPVRAGLVGVALVGAAVGLLGLDSQARAPAPTTVPASLAAQAPIAKSSVSSDIREDPAMDVDDPLLAIPAEATVTPADATPDPLPPERPPRPRAARRPPASTADRVTASAHTETAADARSSPTEAPAPAAESLTAELELLAASRRALAEGRPARALARADDHARRFPSGALAHERDGLRIAALCELGRDAEATRRAADLRRQLGDPEAVRRFTTACDDD